MRECCWVNWSCRSYWKGWGGRGNFEGMLPKKEEDVGEGSKRFGDEKEERRSDKRVMGDQGLMKFEEARRAEIISSCPYCRKEVPTIYLPYHDCPGKIRSLKPKGDEGYGSGGGGMEDEERMSCCWVFYGT